MSDSDFKDDGVRWTADEAIRAMLRVHRIVEPLGYHASVYGGSLGRRGGRDIDLHVVGLGDGVEKRTPEYVGTLLVKELAIVVRHYEQIDVGDVSDIYVVMQTRVGYLDVHIKGSAT